MKVRQRVRKLREVDLNRIACRRWNLNILGLAAVVVLILVFGSLWIMRNLDYSMQSGTNLDQYILGQEAIPR